MSLLALLALRCSRQLHPSSAWRGLSVDGKIGADDGEVAEMIESTITRHPDAAAAAAAPRVLTTRREALSLYREVLRHADLFLWRDERGRVWRDVLRASARAEFEAARAERDAELVARMLVAGRDAVQKAAEALARKRQQIVDEEARAGPGIGGGGGGVPPWRPPGAP
jgi:hypothetical protein